jgi:hypothetical protein
MKGEELLKAGFQVVKPNPPLDRWDLGYYKAARDGKKEKFGILVRAWGHPTGEAGWDAQAQLRIRPKGHVWSGRVFTLELLDVSRMTPGEIEEFFCWAWSRMSCGYWVPPSGLSTFKEREKWQGGDLATVEKMPPQEVEDFFPRFSTAKGLGEEGDSGSEVNL